MSSVEVRKQDDVRTTSVDTGLPRSAQWIPASLDPLVLAAAEQDACTDETACHDTGVLATVPSLQRLPDQSRLDNTCLEHGDN